MVSSRLPVASVATLRATFVPEVFVCHGWCSYRMFDSGCYCIEVAKRLSIVRQLFWTLFSKSNRKRRPSIFQFLIWIFKIDLDFFLFLQKNLWLPFLNSGFRSSSSIQVILISYFYFLRQGVHMEEFLFDILFSKVSKWNGEWERFWRQSWWHKHDDTL